MKKIVFFIGMLSMITIMACKKDKLEDSVRDPIPYGDDVIEINTDIDSNNISGFLSITDTVLIINDTLILPVDTIAKANFFDVRDPNAHKPVTVNSVHVNGSELPFSPLHASYFSSLPSTTLIPGNWDIKGLGTIPDFTYTNLNGVPVYKNYKLLPSSIDRSKDLVFKLNGFINTRYVYVLIDDHVANGIMLGSSPGDSKSVTFLSSLLSQLTPNAESEIEIRFENINYQNFLGKTFAFLNEVVIKKKIVLK